MSIRVKIILIVLPLLVVALVIGGAASFFSATTGVTRVTVELLDFKTSELEKYVDGQWRLLVENELTGRGDMVQAAQAGIEVYSRSIIRSESELIFAVDAEGEVVLASADVELLDDERATVSERAALDARDLFRATIGGVDRMAMAFLFEPFGWYFLVTQERAEFFREVNRITVQTVYLIVGGSVFAIGLLLAFVQVLMRPMTRVVGAMKEIISTSDLSSRVPVEFRDEIGQMSQTFNVMVEELEKATDRIKSYAFDAVLAQKRETKIRNIFQKYVPQELIDRFFQNPESMLVGENREIGILFSDIRSFTTISERLQPDELVESLNRYFSVMVDIIMNREGVIDKYIGDAIMAMFGAPVKHENDAQQSVLAGIEMTEALAEFNTEQRAKDKPEFRIGVGVAYGVVTVGNIGTERKMDYTVIGDMVNVASRLEGLTKQYAQDVIISDTAYEHVKDLVATRLVDAVAVKGRAGGLRIYAVRRSQNGQVGEAWQLHNAAMDHYFAREFERAATEFTQVCSLLPDDQLAPLMRERCDRLVAEPPPPDWDGVEVMETK